MVTQKYLLTEILAFNYCVTLEQLPCADGKVDDLRDGDTGDESDGKVNKNDRKAKHADQKGEEVWKLLPMIF